MMQQKNVIYILCDELRADALGCYTEQLRHTPTIDKIAEEGVYFTSCYCNSPVCVPSRMSILTGLYPEDTGVYHNEAAYPPYHLEETYETIPSVLEKHGYQAASFGKTHLPYGMNVFQTNDGHGGEMHMGLGDQVRNIPHLSPRGAFQSNVGSTYPENMDFYPEVITENGLRWATEQEKPYFLRLSYLQPHTPVIVKNGYDKLYSPEEFDGTLKATDRLSVFEQKFAECVGLTTMMEEERKEMKAYYYGQVSWIDSQVKRVLEYLQERQEEDRTILIIGADHGALRGESGGLGKQIFHRASHQVPCIIYDPGNLKNGQKDARLCSNLDLAVTIFHLLNIDPPEQFRGNDLFGDRLEEEVYSVIGYGETCSYAFPNKLRGRYIQEKGWPRRACIRTSRYRLDMNIRIDGKKAEPEEEDIFFTDYATYPEEDQNLAAEPQYQDVIAELRRKLWEHQNGAVEPEKGCIAEIMDKLEKHQKQHRK